MNNDTKNEKHICKDNMKNNHMNKKSKNTKTRKNGTDSNKKNY